MVTTRQNIRRLLWVACGAATAGIAACVYITLFPGPAEDPVKPPPPALQAAAVGQAALGPIADYAVIWQKNFRPPPAAASQATGPAQAPPGVPIQQVLGITLVGTASDRTAPFGLFREASGQIKCVGIGQKIGEAEVVAIADGAATVRFGGQTIRLTVVKGPGKP